MEEIVARAEGYIKVEERNSEKITHDAKEKEGGKSKVSNQQKNRTQYRSERKLHSSLPGGH